MELLKILIWPIVVIILVVFIVLLLKNSLKDLLTRVTKLKYGETVAEVSQTGQETNQKALLAQNQADKPNENIEKALGIFSIPTIKHAKELVENESKINEIQDPVNKIETLTKYAEVLYLIISFEGMYNLIFGSQLSILEYVNTNNTQTKDDLKFFYDSAKERNPEFYETYPYDDYFNFILAHELIIINPDKTCGITWLGRDFLKYLIEKGKPFSKRY